MAAFIGSLLVCKKYETITGERLPNANTGRASCTNDFRHPVTSNIDGPLWRFYVR
jgi:hypothetical protein